MDEKMKVKMELENEVLELIDNQDIITRSDLQGAVGALVSKIMQKGKEYSGF